MNWIITKPECGEAIRVNAGFFFHYGIYVNDETVIQFGTRDVSSTNTEDICVGACSIDSFARTDSIEVGKYSTAEKLSKRSNEDIVAYAMSKINTKGYSILHNNCEHFIHEVIFGQSRSTLIDAQRQLIREKLNKGDIKK